MSEGLPGRVDVARLAARAARLSNVTPVTAMHRLADLLVDTAASVESELEFAVDEHSRIMVQGRVRAGLAMTCQRCLGPVVVDVDSAFEVEAEDDELSLMELVEDEVLLALPIVAVHDETACSTPVEVTPASGSPFAALGKLIGARSNGSPEES